MLLFQKQTTRRIIYCTFSQGVHTFGDSPHKDAIKYYIILYSYNLKFQKPRIYIIILKRIEIQIKPISGVTIHSSPQYLHIWYQTYQSYILSLKDNCKVFGWDKFQIWYKGLWYWSVSPMCLSRVLQSWLIIEDPAQTRMG